MDPFQRPPMRESWFAPFSVDLVLKVLYVTFLHPFIAWVVVLCFRAEHMEWTATPIRVSIAYATVVTVCWILSAINRRIAYGLPREVDLSEEVIVITGGASGLGLLIAEVYGMRGATVAVLDVKEMENGEARGVTCYKCDITNKEQLTKVAADIERDLGPPTVLINNAAVVSGKRLLDLDLAEIDRTITTNLLSAFYTLRTFIPGIARSGYGGTIVTISSVLGELGGVQLSDYAASKAGLTALHRSITAELKTSHPDIRTVLVTLGQLSTPLFYGVQTPSSFFAPVVEPVDVAKEIISAIDNGKAGEIGMPFYARWIAWYHVLPVSVQKLARYASGMDRAMSTFVGRAPQQGKGRVAKEKSGVLVETS
ncbi:epidermal retinal dehydrogenase 2 [Ophiostoma piceae UAMH 11346]|uniref:Epidermal retinal dehydrogenase 2 n=1 Tax=Ophiostoma piceae (strain UAMH 11346) TaxID=1262450 RepID=S3C1H8_OPHP1|nr:epidermal retinal dehydrogenase 2 [Ophiostoma piceae UAMH 11346]